MYTAKKKISKDKGVEPTEFEETVAQAFFDLENTNQDLKSDLKDLFINSAVQIDVAGNRKAVVIYVPYRLRKAFRKIHLRLVRELEKKFSGKDVVLLATRRIVRPPKKGSAVQRPRTRTLTAVHDAMLEDIVQPAEIVGKRVRYRIDGSKIIKIFLDPKEKNNTEYKLETFAGVYRKLTGKDVVFEYPITDAVMNSLFSVYDLFSLLITRFVKMYTAKKKISKDKGVEPTEFEETVAQAFFDLENTNQDLKSDLKDLFINSAVQIDVAGNRKAVVIYVPYRLRKAFRKIHLRLVRELEKKFSGKDVVLLATRRIVRPPKKGSAVQRPRTRTLTAVHDAMLEDIVQPAEIVGKRVRYRIDGSKIIKIFLDPKEKNNTEYKLETFAGVYRKLTGKDVVFEYPITDA
ncbi:Ribosomal_S7e domain-containing protein [Cephalotus follicularis]|uniref:Ribosomal_S7e domain-containing protein n=1 Tax=Cephalotus follicularis TaxID=3775 RepID=A0A1Q3DAT4_CEPFO|nr:Ribosomal_S7e domain-containing protein [Cephalotus follicularis]